MVLSVWTRRGLGAALEAGVAGLALLAAGSAGSAGTDGPARFRVGTAVVAPAAHHVSATIAAFGNGSDLMAGGNFEPIEYRTRFTVTADSAPGDGGVIAVDPVMLGHYDTLRDGALDGADVSVMRISDGVMTEVRRDRVAPGGFRLSGWQPLDRAAIEGATAKVSVAPYERGGVPRWFAVRAFDAKGRLSDFSEPVRIDLPEKLADPGDPGASPQPAYEGDLHAAADPAGPARPDAPAAAYADPGIVRLGWAAVPGAVGYAVYQSYVAPDRMQGFGLRLEGEGPPLRAGDLLILRKSIDQLDPGKLISDRIWRAGQGRWSRHSLIEDEPGQDARRWWLQPHPADPARRWGQKTFLRADLPGRSHLAIGAFNHAGTAQDWYPVLEPGTRYRVEVRLRGNRPGQASFRFGGPLAGKVEPMRIDYGTEWQQASAEFTVPERLTGDTPGRMELVINGPGQVDVDDLRVFRADTPFMDYTAREYDELARAGLSALRTHGLIKSGQRGYDLRGLLSEGGVMTTTSFSPGLPETLRMMEKAGVDPWLQIEPHLTDAEWAGLVEYLAAPFDPARDDPARLPWAALRVAQGRAAPWTEAFDHIWFEIGNETWNPLFFPWTFPEMTDAATGQKYGAGEVYGLFQARVAGIMRQSPWWQPAGLDDKLSWVIGGWAINDYGEKAATAAGDAADIVTIAAYNGGWDEGEGPPRRTPASFSSVMNQVAQVQIPRTEQLAQATAAAASAEGSGARRGKPMAIGSYEAGPGYALSGLNGATVTPEQAADQEAVMKSRAAGVATLDTFLAQRRLGMSLQNFFMFRDGSYWSSHQRETDGGKPYPAWSLLGLMDAEGEGEMLDVTAESVPVMDVKGTGLRVDVADAPQIAVYATRKGDRLTVFAISRRVPDYPKAGDDGCTPVEIALPVPSVRGARLIRTAGRYDDSSPAGTDPVIERMDLPAGVVRDGVLRIDAAAGGQDCGLPAASALIYVLDTGGAG